MSDHRHLWHKAADGLVRCAFQDCTAAPTEAEAARVLADVAAAAALRIPIAFGSGPVSNRP